MTFDKRQTNIAKGVALLLLLWHHLFYNNPDKYNRFISMYYIMGIPVECFIASFCKVCVAIFLFLSGYGLFKSYEKYSCSILEKSKFGIKEDFVFVKNHLLKLMSGYWFIFVIFVPLGFLYNRNPVEIYEGNVLYFFIDFLGLANVFSTPTMNGTWWFMGVIVVYYIIFPLIMRLFKYSPELVVIMSVFLLFVPNLPDVGQLRTWLIPFCLGMYFAKYDLFYRLSILLDSTLKKVLCTVMLIVSAARIKYDSGFSIKFDFLFAISIIMFCYLVLSRISIISNILGELGKYSGQIFMFHTFIYKYYFMNYIYWFKYSIVIFIVMVAVCYLIARLLSWLMKVTRYNKLINKLITG